MQTALGLDGEILLWIQEFLRIGWLDPVVKAVTHLGDGGFVWILLAVLFLLDKRRRKTGACMAAALLLGFLATNLILKNAVMRPRPYYGVSGLRALVTDPSWSFPSGHSTSSMAAGVVMFRQLEPRWQGRCALAFAVIVCLSRLYVGVHYPSDVVCGAAVGIAAAVCAMRLVGRAWPEGGPTEGWRED